MPRGKKKVIAATVHSNVASSEIMNKDPVIMHPEHNNEAFDESPAQKKITKEIEDAKGDFLEDMDDLLETPFYSLNKLIPQLRQKLHAPDPKYWYVKWFFPNAEGGPLYVDAPMNKTDLEICRKKAKIMKDLGMNYRLFRPESERRLARAESVLEDADEVMAGEF